MNAPLPRDGLRQVRNIDGSRVRRRRSARSPTAATLQSVGWPVEEQISLSVFGLTVSEWRALHRLAAASRRQGPRLELLDASRASEAEVVLIDGADAEAMAWSRAQPWLDRRAVIWIGRQARVHGHMTLGRPIAWATLPIVLAEAMRHAPVVTRALVPRRVQPQAPAVMVLCDDGTVRERLRWLLESAARRATFARSAREGLAALHAAAYDCVILAGHVSDLDRVALCGRVRALERRLGRIPLLLLDDEAAGAWERLRARLAGYDEVATLPSSPAQLLDLLGRHRCPPRPAAPDSELPEGD